MGRLSARPEKTGKLLGHWASVMPFVSADLTLRNITDRTINFDSGQVIQAWAGQPSSLPSSGSFTTDSSRKVES